MGSREGFQGSGFRVEGSGDYCFGFKALRQNPNGPQSTTAREILGV